MDKSVILLMLKIVLLTWLVAIKTYAPKETVHITLQTESHSIFLDKSTYI